MCPGVIVTNLSFLNPSGSNHAPEHSEERSPKAISCLAPLLACFLLLSPLFLMSTGFLNAVKAFCCSSQWREWCCGRESVPFVEGVRVSVLRVSEKNESVVWL